MELIPETRTRLKLTLFGAICVALSASFPLYYISLNPYNVGAWTCLGLIITSFVTLIGYYVNKETQRQSVVSMSFEDHSDPEDIPL